MSTDTEESFICNLKSLKAVTMAYAILQHIFSAHYSGTWPLWQAQSYGIDQDSCIG